MSRSARYLCAAGVAGFLAFLYLRTLAHGLTWAFDGADGGDLVTATATGGVPHPTGYPTYLLIASAFLRLPIGSFAYRTNLLSAVCMIAAALLVFLVTVSVSRSPFAASIAAVSFGTFSLAWSQAIITEVNALHAAFIAAILYLAVAGATGWIPDVGTGLMAGLGIGNHLTTVLVLPLLALGRGQEHEKLELIGRKIGLRRALGVLIGLSVYAVIPIRAANQAPVNWGNAINWQGFAWLVTGRLYWDRLDGFGASYLWTAFRAWSRFLISQLSLAGLLLLFVSLAFAARRSLLFIATGYIAVIYSIFSILYYSPDSYVYLLPLLISLAIWIGLGSQWLLERIPARQAAWRPLAGTALLAALAVRAVLSIPAMDLSKDRAAEDFAWNALRGAPARAILVTSGDEATFSLWYYGLAEHERQDVAVVVPDLLPQLWYRQVLMKAYPDLALPEDPLPAELASANPGRPVCSADIEADGRLACEP